jgi:hypothetical protein
MACDPFEDRVKKFFLSENLINGISSVFAIFAVNNAFPAKSAKFCSAIASQPPAPVHGYGKSVAQ